MATKLSKGLIVKLSPTILENESRKQSHFLFQCIIDEDLTGEVVNYEKSEHHNGWWVKFKYGRILLQEDDVLTNPS